MLRKRKVAGIPILKLPPNRLIDVVLALSEHEYDRDGFKDKVLSFFSGKIEKSVFRGMAIPTLRALGILVGFEREMHLSGNGALVVAAHNPKRPGMNETIQAILLEIEHEKGLDAGWQKNDMLIDDIRKAFYEIDKSGEGTIPTGDFAGRLNRWLNYLEFFHILKKANSKFLRIMPFRNKKMPLSQKSLSNFAADFRASYKALVPRGVGEPVISVESLHKELALLRWKKKKEVITRRIFDELLTASLRKEILNIHLHRSMGAEQGLFVYNGIAYQSVSIRETRHANTK